MPSISQYGMGLETNQLSLQGKVEESIRADLSAEEINTWN
jgi:hypothetical protein